MAHHELKAGPGAVHWGYLDAKLAPRVIIDSGDSVTMHCVSGGPGEVGVRTDLLPEHKAILEQEKPFLGPHILTGPVAVRGAMPGDTLEVRIRSVDLRVDWAYNGIKPLRGTLPEDFPMLRILQIPLDRQRIRLFTEALGTLPPRCREVFLLHRLHQCSYQHIAQRLGDRRQQRLVQPGAGTLGDRHILRHLRAHREAPARPRRAPARGRRAAREARPVRRGCVSGAGEGRSADR